MSLHNVEKRRRPPTADVDADAQHTIRYNIHMYSRPRIFGRVRLQIGFGFDCGCAIQGRGESIFFIFTFYWLILEIEKKGRNKEGAQLGCGSKVSRAQCKCNRIDFSDWL